MGKSSDFNEVKEFTILAEFQYDCEDLICGSSLLDVVDLIENFNQINKSRMIKLLHNFELVFQVFLLLIKRLGLLENLHSIVLLSIRVES